MPFSPLPFCLPFYGRFPYPVLSIPLSFSLSLVNLLFYFSLLFSCSLSSLRFLFLLSLLACLSISPSVSSSLPSPPFHHYSTSHLLFSFFLFFPSLSISFPLPYLVFLLLSLLPCLCISLSLFLSLFFGLSIYLSLSLPSSLALFRHVSASYLLILSSFSLFSLPYHDFSFPLFVTLSFNVSQSLPPPSYIASCCRVSANHLLIFSSFSLFPLPLSVFLSFPLFVGQSSRSFLLLLLPSSLVPSCR